MGVLQHIMDLWAAALLSAAHSSVSCFLSTTSCRR